MKPQIKLSAVRGTHTTKNISECSIEAQYQFDGTRLRFYALLCLPWTFFSIFFALRRSWRSRAKSRRAAPNAPRAGPAPGPGRAVSVKLWTQFSPLKNIFSKFWSSQKFRLVELRPEPHRNYVWSQYQPRFSVKKKFQHFGIWQTLKKVQKNSAIQKLRLRE